MLNGPFAHREREMTCVHLRKLYQLCHDENLRIGGTDLVRIVCHQCGEQEVCPSMLMDEYDAADVAKNDEESSGPKTEG